MPTMVFRQIPFTTDNFNARQIISHSFHESYQDGILVLHLHSVLIWVEMKLSGQILFNIMVDP